MVSMASLLSPFKGPRQTGASEPVLGSKRMACIGTSTRWHYLKWMAGGSNAREPLSQKPGLSIDMIHPGR